MAGEMIPTEPNRKIVFGPEPAKGPVEPEVPSAPGPEPRGSESAIKSKTEVEMRLYWAVWMDLTTGNNNHAGPAMESDVDEFIVKSRVTNPKMYFWKVPLGGRLPWRDGMEMYEAYAGKRFR